MTLDQRTRAAHPVPPRPRLFPETEHEESVYDQWRSEIASGTTRLTFRAWYTTRFEQQ